MADVTEVLKAVGDMIVSDSERMSAKKDISPDAKKALGTLLNAYRKLLWQTKNKPGDPIRDLDQMTEEEREAFLEQYGDEDFADALMAGTGKDE